MSLHQERLADIATVAASATPIVTNPSGKKTFVKGYEFHNTSTASETLKVWNVPDAAGALGVAADGNRFLNITLAPNETAIYVPPAYGHVLSDANDSIQAMASTAGKITVQVSGDREY